MGLKSYLSIFAATGALFSGTAALAGGYAAPVTETPIVVVETAAPVSDWAGGYAGASIGYSFGADDEIGFEDRDNGVTSGRYNGLGNVDVSGVTGDLHAGYRWQRGGWVFGPELSIEGGSVDESDDIDVTSSDGSFALAGEVKSEVNWIGSLLFKAGYTVNPQTLVYGAAGVTRGDFDYSLTTGGETTTKGYSATGYVVGLGVERKLNERLSAFAEYQYRNYGKTDVTYNNAAGDLVTRATPEHSNIKLGVNFSF